MKTQVIQLDEHDDVISVRDRMSWAKTPRLLLVFPRSGPLLERRLDLRLLQHHARSLGAQLALVTRSAPVRTLAGELGLPVFASVSQAQREDWSPADAFVHPGRPRHRPDLRQARRESLPAEGGWRVLLPVRLGLFALAVFSLLALLVLFLPSATIRLQPAVEQQRLSLDLSSSSAVTAINLAGRLPAYTATQVVEGTQSDAATGKSELPEQAAQGTVRFRNLTTGAVGIPSGTVVRTVGTPLQRFATTADGVAAAGVGKTVDLPVQALAPGSAGNLPPDSLVAIEGDLGLSLAATNPAATSGGTDTSSTFVTAADQARLRAALLVRLRQLALIQLGQALDAGDVLFPQSLTVPQVLTETYIPAAGQPGTEVVLDLRIQVQAEYARAADIQTLAASVMNANLPEGFAARPGALVATVASAPVTAADGVTTWQMNVARPVYAVIDPGQAAALVQGLKVREARARLGQFYQLAAPAKLALTPAWWPWLPWLSFRTLVTVQ